MVEQSGFEPSARLRLFIAKLPANLAGYSGLIKAAQLQSIVATNSPSGDPLWPLAMNSNVPGAQCESVRSQTEIWPPMLSSKFSIFR